MEQVDLFGDTHTIYIPPPQPTCTAGPDTALEVLTAVAEGLIDLDGQHKHGEFGPDHRLVLANLQAEEYVRPGTGSRRGTFVLTPRGHQKLQRWTALVTLPKQVHGDG
nr:hypothetical protein [Kibdelosporangium sp. MJ126-NF4]CTQ96903.1 hypothetical protein [Kibdelosporangium sp. MJ126-NF4]